MLGLRGARATAVIDAKYKRLAPSRERPSGVDQDLYQPAVYASRYEPERVAALVYPRDRDTEPAHAEARGPSHGAGMTFESRRLPPSRQPADTNSRRF
jgi:5-methylcytosine-specific restriction endonuclease McrBC regulatory subunit McrC